MGWLLPSKLSTIQAMFDSGETLFFAFWQLSTAGKRHTMRDRFLARSLDDLLLRVFPAIMEEGTHISPGRGPANELYGVLLTLKNPRARLSRSETRGKPFSCLGELLWYLTGDNSLEFIRYYISQYEEESEDGETVYGGYGPRLFRNCDWDQVRSTIDLLRKKPDSRRAVIQILSVEDICGRHKEIPCTCAFQFAVRNNRLQMITTMRSNDAYKGLPHDIFCFTMIQEIVARSLGLELGVYKHFVGSLHLYDGDRDLAMQYLSEGVQSTLPMPPMPRGDPWPSIRKLLDAEHFIRVGAEVDADSYGIHPYWSDLVRLLQVYAATGNLGKIDEIKSHMVFRKYDTYIDPRKSMKAPRSRPAQQLRLPL